jgi:AcrR family transcriptional regulator
MRAIAREAGVDPSLPRHYFPSKSVLFVEALGPFDQVSGKLARILDGPRSELGSRMMGIVLGLWDSPETGPRLRVLLTSAAASPEVSDLARDLLFGRVFLPIASAIAGEDVEGRAAAAMTQVLGLVVARYVLRIEPLASAPSEVIIARLAPNLQRLIEGDSL